MHDIVSARSQRHPTLAEGHREIEIPFAPIAGVGRQRIFSLVWSGKLISSPGKN